MARHPKKERYDACIIGAGAAGLTAAIDLARAGRSVLIVEQHYRVGGFLHSFRRRPGFVFDSAVRVVAGAERGLLADILADLDLAGNIPFIPLNESYAVRFPGMEIKVPADLEGFTQAYQRAFPGDAAGIASMVAEMQRIYAVTVQIMRANDAAAVLTSGVFQDYQNSNFYDFASRYVKDPQAISAIAALWGYFGVPPQRLGTLFLSYALMRYFVEGTYYVQGSFQTFADAMADQAKAHGAEILLGASVDQVVVEQGRVQGLRIGEDFVQTEMVISAGDLPKLMNDLVGPEHFGRRLRKRTSQIPKSLAAFEVFIGTDLPLEDMGVGHETLLYRSFDSASVYESFLDRGKSGGLGACLLSCPSLVDPSLAPANRHTAIITTFLKPDAAVDWSKEKPRIEQALLNAAEEALPGLKNHILMVESGSPATVERFTGNSGGASYGYEQSLEWLNKRPGASSGIEGLFLCGHWTGAGGGVVAAMLSAHRLCKNLDGAKGVALEEGA